MNVSTKPHFVTSGEKALLAFKGVRFTITRVETSHNTYGRCWHVYARFEKPALEKIISLPSTPKRDNAMNEITKKLETCGSLADVTLCYRWRAYHFVSRERWRKPPSLDTVLFLK